MPSQVSPNLRAATADDTVDLSAIRAACFNTLWEAKTFADMLARPENVCLIVPGVAYAMAQKIPPEAEIITIAVLPEFRRRGIAEHMMRELTRQFIAEGIHTLHLEVNEKKTAAQQLYAKLGFTPSGRRAGYYVNSAGERADAILMQLSLLA